MVSLRRECATMRLGVADLSEDSANRRALCLFSLLKENANYKLNANMSHLKGYINDISYACARSGGIMKPRKRHVRCVK